MKADRKMVSAAERAVALLALLESAYAGAVCAAYPPQTPHGVGGSLLAATLFTFFLGRRLIYRAAPEGRIARRERGYFYGALLYLPHLIFSFVVDIQVLFWTDGRWPGLLLFLLKLAAVLFFWAAVGKGCAAAARASGGRAETAPCGSPVDRLGTLALYVLLAAERFCFPDTSPWNWAAGLLQIVVFGVVLFWPQHPTPACKRS